VIMCRLSQQAVDDILRAGVIYEVGGTVRDRFLERDLRKTDRDYLVTGVPYDQLTGILKNHGRVDLVGQNFGVIKFTQMRADGPNTFDITLPRTEHSIGAGHRDFEVNFDPNLPVERDLIRRDFTVNAMAVALDSDELIDPLDGKSDLDARQLKMVYGESFSDDPLRMMRAMQFAARFDFDIEPLTFAAMTAHAAEIKTVSPERVAEELTKLLVLSDQPSKGFRLMESCGLLKHILPELQNCVDCDQPGGFHRWDVFEHTIRAIDACPPQLNLRLAALFHDINKPQAKRPVDGGATFYGHETLGARSARTVMQRLRFSHDLIKQVMTLVDRHMFTTAVSDKGLRRLVRRVGVDLVFDLLDLRRADVVAQGMGGTTEDVDEFEANIKAELDRKPPFSLSDLAIGGTEIMEIFSLEPGPAVGRILDHLMEAVLDNPQVNTDEQLRQAARNHFEQMNTANYTSTDEEDGK
jgi:tRNA nucleotidyltransferase (CCA-adding enzyme)